MVGDVRSFFGGGVISEGLCHETCQFCFLDLSVVNITFYILKNPLKVLFSVSWSYIVFPDTPLTAHTVVFSF